MQRAVGKPITIQRRADGKPHTRSKWTVSAAHMGDLSFAVATPKGIGLLGCDLEAVTTRSREIWQDLLGNERVALADTVADSGGEAFDVTATRVWCAVEALKKAGLAIDTPLTVATTTPDHWVLFKAGDCTVATYVAQMHGVTEAVVAAVAVTR